MENISKLCLAFQLGDFRDVKDLLDRAGVNITWHRETEDSQICGFVLVILCIDILCGQFSQFKIFNDFNIFISTII